MRRWRRGTVGEEVEDGEAGDGVDDEWTEAMASGEVVPGDDDGRERSLPIQIGSGGRGSARGVLVRVRVSVGSAEAI
jgi:hypothetical protein